MNQTERQLQWLQQHGYVRRDELDFLPRAEARGFLRRLPR